MQRLLTAQKKARNIIKIKYNLVFLAYLLMLLASWSCFYFKAIDLTISLAIDSIVSMALKIAIIFLE